MSPYGHWRRRVVHWISAYKARKMLPTVKYVHLLHNDKFAKPFVDFLNRNFPTTEHLVLCQRTANHPFPSGPNVLEVRKFFKGINLDRPNIDKIICHSLFVNEIVEYFYRHPEFQKAKAYWLIYGGDLYEAPRDEKNDFVRRNFRGWITDTDGDELIAKYKYDSNVPFINAGYSFPITIEMINAAKKQPHDYIQIQINNSCDRTTIEVLEMLAKFSNENLAITTILSYGGSIECRQDILDCGKRLFGNKFKPILAYMTPTEYARHMAQNDVLILNQNRQQGLGNSLAALALGVKLFIKGSVTTYTHFNAKGIRVYDTDSINNASSILELAYIPLVEREINMKLSRHFFDDSYLTNLWNPVFKTEN